jgi:hypothetical protein
MMTVTATKTEIEIETAVITAHETTTALARTMTDVIVTAIIVGAVDDRLVTGTGLAAVEANVTGTVLEIQILATTEIDIKDETVVLVIATKPTSNLSIADLTIHLEGRKTAWGIMSSKIKKDIRTISLQF